MSARYSFTNQTPKKLEIVAKFQKGITRNDLEVTMTKSTIRVKRKGDEHPVIEVHCTLSVNSFWK
jgi:hypothetical protein